MKSYTMHSTSVVTGYPGPSHGYEKDGAVVGPILDGRFVHSDEYFAKYPPPVGKGNYWTWRRVLQGCE